MRADDLPLWERTLIATYPWRRVRPIPVARPGKPVTESRVALVTTAGLVPPMATPFDLSRLGGDTTFRVISRDVRASELEVHHRSEAFDRSALALDLNVAFPLFVLDGLALSGDIGEVAPRHLSFMGSITAPARLRKESAPAAADLLVDDGVDVALLAPV